MSMKDLLQNADWKKEKHVPVIELKDSQIKGEVVVEVSVGKEIAHPNTTEHHISWLALYFLPNGEKFPYQLGKVDFSTHGESVQGPNTSTIYVVPKVTVTFKTEKSGNLLAVSYCNIHGLWESSINIAVNIK